MSTVRMRENVLGEVTNTKRDKLESDNPESGRNEEIKKLKIELADALFDLKKAQEDFAQFKRAARSDREKDSRKFQETIARLRLDLEYQTEAAEMRANKHQNQHCNALNDTKKQLQQQFENQILFLTNKYQNQIAAKDKLHERKMQDATLVHKKIIQQIKITNDTQTEEMKAKYENQKRQYMLKNKTLLEEKQKKLDSLITGLQSQKKTEEKQHEKTRVQGAKEREKILSQLCYERNLKMHAETQIIERDLQISTLKQIIIRKEKDAANVIQQHQNRLNELLVEFQKQKNILKRDHERETTKIINVHLEELQKCNKTIEQMECLHQQRISNMQLSFQEMAAKFVARPPRKEDLAQIAKLEQTVAKKEDQRNKLLRQLKHCNLQLQNKEDIYSRIFKGSSANRHDKKQNILPQKTAREELFRKSHTADIKFLLKMYGNPK